jgi:hypothetical protein
VSFKDFVDSGWRPAAGWVCVASIGYAIVGYSLMSWMIAWYALATQQTAPEVPKPDAGILLEIIGVLLTLGGYRTYEKTKGTQNVVPPSTSNQGNP